jgi:hypothetical protein
MNDLEQLREDVRATAPEPRPDFAARLERRVEAGFEAAKPPREPRRLSLRGPAVVLACTAALAVVVGLAASVDTGTDEEEGGSAAGGSAELAEPAPERGGGASNESAAPDRDRSPVTLAPGPATEQSGGARRRVVEQHAALELETAADEFADVTAGVLRVADDTGSIVQRSTVDERDGRGFAQYDLRIPASRLDEAMADLSRLGHVTSRRASTQDITAPYVSAANRLEDARAERRALLKALERADTEAEADALRQQIRLARDRIVIAERDVRALQRRADRARVSVTVQSTGRRSAGAWTPGDAVDDAGRILEVAAGVVVVTAAALAPFALLGLLAALARRAVRRRRREAALGAR